jgi:hypothetical protein
MRRSTRKAIGAIGFTGPAPLWGLSIEPEVRDLLLAGTTSIERNDSRV